MVRQSLQQKIRELDLRGEDWGNGGKPDFRAPAKTDKGESR